MSGTTFTVFPTHLTAFRVPPFEAIWILIVLFFGAVSVEVALIFPLVVSVFAVPLVAGLVLLVASSAALLAVYGLALLVASSAALPAVFSSALPAGS